jgi:hypothetical protein
MKIEDNEEGLRLIVDGADVIDPFAAEHAGEGLRNPLVGRFGFGRLETPGRAGQ